MAMFLCLALRLDPLPIIIVSLVTDLLEAAFVPVRHLEIGLGVLPSAKVSVNLKNNHSRCVDVDINAHQLILMIYPTL